MEVNYFTILYWFCHISTWICHRYTRVPHSEPPPSSFPIPSLWVVPVHQPQASSIMHRTWTGNLFHIWYYTCFNDSFLIHRCITDIFGSQSLTFAILLGQRVKHLSAMLETRVRSLGQEVPLDKEMATHSSILPGKSHRWRSLVGCSPWGRKESDTTERLHFSDQGFSYFLDFV